MTKNAARKDDVKEFKIFAAREDDVHQGWAWLKNPDLPPRCVIKIKNSKTHKSVHCEALQIDENFLKNYNQHPRCHIKEPTETLVIGEWYRAKLGGVPTQSNISLLISASDTWLGQFHASIDHPQVVVRLATQLGVLGLILGIIGLLLGILTLF